MADLSKIEAFKGYDKVQRDITEPTLWRGKLSKTSRSFVSIEKLMEYFHIPDGDKAFMSAYSRVRDVPTDKLGARELVLHSSALLALLFFYEVSEQNPLSILIKNQTVKFVETLFEVGNKCVNGRKPSMVDVVLLGEDQNTILYLESKFFEPTNGGKQIMSSTYHEERLFEKHFPKFFEDTGISMSKTYFDEKKRYVFCLSMGGKTTEYLQGVKQMICHWIGVNKGAVDDSLREKLHSYKRRLLGTVVYDNPNTQKKYGKLYEKLRTYLNELSDIEVMPLITYQELIKQNPNLINGTIADFYGLSPDA